MNSTMQPTDPSHYATAIATLEAAGFSSFWQALMPCWSSFRTDPAAATPTFRHFHLWSHPDGLVAKSMSKPHVQGAIAALEGVQVCLANGAHPQMEIGKYFGSVRFNCC